ncbi:MAG: ABC transporter permease [Treponema sp.]|jgi:simple sugar transport system permease protein|nr:ABC transporter permease [Treponema sp.]
MNFLRTIINLIPSVLMVTAPILICATGGMISERSGVANIALEGLMTIGAMAAATTHYLLEMSGGFSIPVALVLAAVTGGLFAAIHAFASITLQADQIVSGTGLNLLSTGLAMFVSQLLFRQERTPPYRMGMLPGFGGIYPTAWIAVGVLALAWFFMYKRPCGLRLRTCGEHPAAAVSMGINVLKTRYIAVILSGVLGGLAGGCLVLTQTIQFTPSTINGKGFIALAAVCFGRWLPLGILGSSLLFGASAGLAIYIYDIVLLKFLPPEFFNLMPYAITLLTLVIFSGRDYAPRACGIPFDAGRS